MNVYVRGDELARGREVQTRARRVCVSLAGAGTDWDQILMTIRLPSPKLHICTYVMYRVIQKY
jgi:hypothetical protein